MKIEIDLSEIEHLKEIIQELKKENTELREKIEDVDESELKSKAVALSWRLFEKYMSATFEKLGFDMTNNEAIKRVNGLSHWLGVNWWESKDLTIELNAHVTNQFRNAYLYLGIITKEEKEKMRKDEKDHLELI